LGCVPVANTIIVDIRDEIKLKMGVYIDKGEEEALKQMNEMKQEVQTKAQGIMTLLIQKLTEIATKMQPNQYIELGRSRFNAAYQEVTIKFDSIKKATINKFDSETIKVINKVKEYQESVENFHAKFPNIEKLTGDFKEVGAGLQADLAEAKILIDGIKLLAGEIQKKSQDLWNEMKSLGDETYQGVSASFQNVSLPQINIPKLPQFDFSFAPPSFKPPSLDISLPPLSLESLKNPNLDLTEIKQKINEFDTSLGIYKREIGEFSQQLGQQINQLKQSAQDVKTFAGGTYQNLKNFSFDQFNQFRAQYQDISNDLKTSGKAILKGYADGIVEDTYELESKIKRLSEIAQKMSDISLPALETQSVSIGGILPDFSSQLKHEISKFSGLNLTFPHFTNQADKVQNEVNTFYKEKIQGRFDEGKQKLVQAGESFNQYIENLSTDYAKRIGELAEKIEKISGDVIDQFFDKIEESLNSENKLIGFILRYPVALKKTKINILEMGKNPGEIMHVQVTFYYRLEIPIVNQLIFQSIKIFQNTEFESGIPDNIRPLVTGVPHYPIRQECILPIEIGEKS